MDTIIDNVQELSLELPEMSYFGIADWQKFCGVTLMPKHIASVAKFPRNESKLNSILNSRCPFHAGKMVYETHLAFIGLDTMSIMELQKLKSTTTKSRFTVTGPGVWYKNERFATEVTLRSRVYLLLIDIVPDSEDRELGEQMAMLPEGYEVPTAVEETAKDFLIFKRTGSYANANRYARTADICFLPDRVMVGKCDADGVKIEYVWDNHPSRLIGIGASRRLAL